MINMLLLKKNSDILFSLGAKVKALRLSCNWTRQELADRANVPYSTLTRLEQTGQGSMSTYIQVLRPLNAIQGLENLVEPPTPSPIEMMKFKGNVRQRGSGAGRKSRPPIEPEKKVFKSKPTSMTKAEQDQLIVRFWANLRQPSAAETAFFAERAAAGFFIGIDEDGHLFCHDDDGLLMLKEHHRKNAEDVAAGRKSARSLLMFQKDDLKGYRFTPNPASEFEKDGEGW